MIETSLPSDFASLASPAPATRAPRLAVFARRVLRENATILAAGLGLAAALEALAVFVGGAAPGRPWRGLAVPAIYCFMGFWTVAGWQCFRRRGWRVALREAVDPGRHAGGLLAGLTTILFLNAFYHYKAVMQSVVPFWADVPLAELDRVLHLGRDPWVWLHPVFGTPAAVAALDALYYLWFALLFYGPFAYGWMRPSAERTRFFVAYFLLWTILGVVAATALSSGGPVYFATITGQPDPFAPLLAHLQQVNVTHPLRALEVQAMLWDGYVGRGEPEGISAMPSLHVAVPVLFACMFWSRRRALSLALAGYTVLIAIGSVYLAWHYALDGYASVLGALAVWWLSGRIISTPPSGPQSTSSCNRLSS